jgi:hypothetical protein
MTSQELIDVSRQAQLAGEGCIEVTLAPIKSVYWLSVSEDDESCTFHFHGIYLTPDGSWKSAKELSLYDEEDNIREDVDTPEVPVSLFLRKFASTGLDTPQEKVRLFLVQQIPPVTPTACRTATDDLIEFLNEALELDRVAVSALIETRIPCNQKVKDRPTSRQSGQPPRTGQPPRRGLPGGRRRGWVGR